MVVKLFPELDVCMCLICLWLLYHDASYYLRNKIPELNILTPIYEKARRIKYLADWCDNLRLVLIASLAIGFALSFVLCFGAHGLRAVFTVVAITVDMCVVGWWICKVHVAVLFIEKTSQLRLFHGHIATLGFLYCWSITTYLMWVATTDDLREAKLDVQQWQGMLLVASIWFVQAMCLCTAAVSGYLWFGIFRLSQNCQADRQVKYDLACIVASLILTELQVFVWYYLQYSHVELSLEVLASSKDFVFCTKNLLLYLLCLFSNSEWRINMCCEDPNTVQQSQTINFNDDSASVLDSEEIGYFNTVDGRSNKHTLHKVNGETLLVHQTYMGMLKEDSVEDSSSWDSKVDCMLHIAEVPVAVGVQAEIASQAAEGVLELSATDVQISVHLHPVDTTLHTSEIHVAMDVEGEIPPPAVEAHNISEEPNSQRHCNRLLVE